MSRSRPNAGEPVIIVGAGAVGLSCAWYLAEAGCAVTVIDRGHPGAATSWGNCGLIEPSHADPLTQPAALVTALTSAWRRDAPLRIPFPKSRSRAAWLARFATHCRGSHRRHARNARLALLLASRDLLEELLATAEIDADYQRAGLLTLYRDPRNFRSHREVHEALAVPYRTFDGDELEALPVAPAPGVAAAILTACDGHLDPVRLAGGLVAALSARGVTIESGQAVAGLLRTGDRVSGVRLAGGEHRLGRVVLAAGPWSRALAAAVGLSLPIEPARGLSITWRRPAEGHRHPIYFYERKVVLTPWRDGFRLGSTLEFCGFDERVPPHRLEPLLRAPGEYLRTQPDFSLADGEHWAGFRPMTIDELPLIGPSSRVPGLFLACGHGQLGISQCAGTGRLIADLATGRPPVVDPSPYAPARFAV